jgi:genome maintenance exonuclease 1
MFTHNTLPKIKLLQENGSSGRRYVTETGKAYPSITTVLGAVGDNSWLNEWRAKVGEDEAKAISNRAAKRGTAIHAYSEDYLNNIVPNVNMFDGDMWKSFKPVLNAIDNIRMLEGRMYSDRLELAGTVDCIADYEGGLSIIDFKTSSRVKSASEIENYFIQCAAYACMAQELYGILPKKIVILMAVDDDKPIVFVKNTWDYVPRLLEVLKLYKSLS